MPRDHDKVCRALQEAALALFGAHGYDRVTSAQIAERAGVTERTFFRHFADKREVLFGGEAELAAVLAEAVAGAPPTLGAWGALLRAFRATAPHLTANRLQAQARRRIVASSPALQERELAKATSLTAALASALHGRDTPEPTASLAAQVGMAVFGRAFASWLDDGGAADLEHHIDAAFREARTLIM